MSMTPNGATAQEQQPSLQAVVVHKAQLTAANMKQLAESGYTIMTDPELLIFARPTPAQEEQADDDVVAAMPGRSTAPATEPLSGKVTRYSRDER